MNLVLSAACDEVRERPDGKLDLIGVFNELHAPGFPAVQEHMTVVMVIEWDRGEAGEMRIAADLEHANGTKILTIEGTTDVETRPEDRTAAQTRLILPLERVVFPEPGPYTFTLRAGEREFRAIPLFLSQAETTGT